ncbi:MAG: pitrilysin family protein [Cyclobacteriaceae bacterium]
MNSYIKYLIFLIVSMTIACTPNADQSTNTSPEVFKAPREMGLPSSEFTMPNPEAHRVALDNGLVAFVVTGNKADLVTIKAVVGAGYAYDKKGVGQSLKTILQRQPVCDMSTQEFGRYLYDNAFEYSVSQDEEMTTISLNALAEDYDKAMALFAKIVNQPCINGQTSRLFKGYAGVPNTDYVKNGSLPKTVELLKQHLYGDHPFNAQVTAAEAAAISVADLKAFHQKYFSSGNMAVAVSGQISADQVKSDLANAFAGVTTSERQQANFDYMTSSKASIGHTTNKLQTWIVIGSLLPEISLEEWPALEVMNYIIGGGHFDTRLYKETRDLRGLTNDDSGFPDWKQTGPGLYTFRTYGRPEVADQLIDLTMTEINKIRDTKVTEEELFVAKGTLADGVFQMWFENSHTTAATFAEHWVRYQSFDHLSKYPERVNALTVEEVQAAAQKYLNPEELVTLVMASPGQ